MDQQATDKAKQRANLKVAAFGGSIALAMVGMSYAAVPLYALFCQVTGYGGTTQRADTYSDTVLDRTITVRFDANTAGVPWQFQPVKREITLRIGETGQAHYSAKNTARYVSSGTASFNVSPALAGVYFNKVECFCFTEQTLQPGETADMPVVFYVDPAIVDDPDVGNIKTITLSYTFFPDETGSKPVAAVEVDSQIKTNSTTSQ